MRLHGTDQATVNFTFDGKPFTAIPGETLAAALLANGVKLVARSFKYHRPRGIMTAGSEEPNALVTIGSGPAQDPNIRATMQEVYDGLEARSQNAWPSLKHDVMAINDVASPFLGAGFYYKTFMWPQSFWEKLYEPMIRRAAGLGSLSQDHNADTYEKAFAFCDVLVIGAGPSGLMAALTAGRAGADVILCEEDARLGGRLRGEKEDIAGAPALDWVAQTVAELRAMPNVRVMPRTTVTGAFDHGTYSALERVGQHVPRADHLPRDCFWRIVATEAILCAGAIERPIAFPNNDRPGVMMAGAVRTYINRWGVAPGQSVAVFCNNDDAHRTALDLMAQGLGVAAVIDSRPSAAALGDYRLIAGGQVTATKGRHALSGITVRAQDRDILVDCDCLAVSGGWNPTVHLTCHMNGRPVWNADIASFTPAPDAVPGLTPVGACNGQFTTYDCLADAAKTTAALLNTTAPAIPAACATPYAMTPLWQVQGKGRKWLDFQNDVHVKDIRLAAQESFRSVEHMKRYTTQGMAPDQGKSSNVVALAVLADATGRAIPDTGTTTFRPPFVPTAIAAMGAGGQGQGFAPERHMTSHAASLARSAPMIEAGLWYRPSYFPLPGEDHWRVSCDREIGYVRKAVGICDVSTLGKIDVQGPDAGAFLDFVYCNTFSTLKPGRTRYGLMLREDGHVMDDGTAARLSDTHYLITTTTAAAGQVMRHLAFVAQVLRPELDVQVTSVTEQWAQFAVAGPQSRALLQSLVDADISNADWPFMACGAVTILGTQGRLFRISFSGELAFELAVPACYGDSLFRLLTAQAEAMGGGAYGMEALNVLRIEKGFITHAEIDGRVTAGDLGMARMVSDKKDCIGLAASRRPGLMDPARPQLVGLRSVDGQSILAGAHLFAVDAQATRSQSAGHVSSHCYSPTLDAQIALGFLANGAARMGETIKAVDHLRNQTTLCEVCAPVFFDPEGTRTRG